jgi:hypothetical protein
MVPAQHWHSETSAQPIGMDHRRQIEAQRPSLDAQARLMPWRASLAVTRRSASLGSAFAIRGGSVFLIEVETADLRLIR